MKLTMKVKDFKILARTTLQIASQSNTIPGFTLFMMDIDDSGRIRMMAQDSDAGAITFKTIREFSPGSVVLTRVNMDKLMSMVPDYNSISMTLTVGKGPMIKIVAGDAVIKIPKNPEEDFPTFPKPVGRDWFDVEAPALRKIMKHVLWASEGGNRPNLDGVHMSSELSEASSGYAASTVRPGVVPAGVDIMIPCTAWARARTFIDEDATSIKMQEEGGRRVWFRGDGWLLFVRLNPNKFPSAIIEQMTFDRKKTSFRFRGDDVKIYNIEIHRADMADAVRRIGISSISSNGVKVDSYVKFDIRDDNELYVMSSYGPGSIVQGIAVEEKMKWNEGTVTEDDASGFHSLLEILLDANLLKRSLDSCRSELLTLSWSDERTAPVQICDEKQNILSLIMPIGG